MSGGKQLSFPTFKSNIQKESDPVGKIVFSVITNLSSLSISVINRMC